MAFWFILYIDLTDWFWRLEDVCATGKKNIHCAVFLKRTNWWQYTVVDCLWRRWRNNSTDDEDERSRPRLDGRPVESEMRPGPHDGDLELELQTKNGLNWRNSTNLCSAFLTSQRRVAKYRALFWPVNSHFPVCKMLGVGTFAYGLCVETHRRVLCTLIFQRLRILSVSMWKLGACCLVNHIEN